MTTTLDKVSALSREVDENFEDERKSKSKSFSAVCGHPSFLFFFTHLIVVF